MAQNVTFGGASNPFSTAARWIKVWVGMVVIAFVIVCFFLVAIISALKSIDKSLGSHHSGSDHHQRRNRPSSRTHRQDQIGFLRDIDTNLKPIPGQADTIIGSLTTIDRQVANVNSSLANTSSTLTTALGGLKTEDDILEEANQLGRDRKGVERIIAQAVIVNPILVDDIATDLDAVAVRHLSRANGAAKHVQNICTSARVLAQAAGAQRNGKLAEASRGGASRYCPDHRHCLGPDRGGHAHPDFDLCSGNRQASQLDHRQPRRGGTRDQAGGRAAKDREDGSRHPDRSQAPQPDAGERRRRSQEDRCDRQEHQPERQGDRRHGCVDQRSR